MGGLGLELAEELARLVELSNVTGREDDVTHFLLEAWADRVDSARVDRAGNYVGLRRGRLPEGQLRVLVAAHVDSVGLMVAGIEPGGFLRAAPVGGVDGRYLLGLEVVVHGRGPVAGVVGARPPHITRPEERRSVPPVSELFIDTGLPEDEVRELVSPGDPVTWRRPLLRLRNGRVAGRSLDNRAGVAALGVALRELRHLGQEADFYAVGTVGEEFGGMPGARAAAQAIRPHVAIALDVTFGSHHGAGDDHFPLDGGPTIMVGPNCHPGLVRFLREVASAEGIPHAMEVSGGSSGTDAWVMQVAAEGSVTGVVSIPLRYMHTPVEVVSLSDIRLAGRLVAAAVARLEEGMVRGWTSLS